MLSFPQQDHQSFCECSFYELWAQHEALLAVGKDFIPPSHEKECIATPRKQMEMREEVSDDEGVKKQSIKDGGHE